MSEPAKDEAELRERVAKAFCCPSPSGCVDNTNCDKLDFQIDAIRAIAAIRAAGWAVVPVAEADLEVWKEVCYAQEAELQWLRADNNQLQEKFDSACFLLREAEDTLARMFGANYPLDSIIHFLEENDK
jgi:hypothetical protein